MTGFDAESSFNTPVCQRYKYFMDHFAVHLYSSMYHRNILLRLVTRSETHAATTF